MPITLDKQKIKIAIEGRVNKSENAITNYLTNIVWPKLQTKIETKMNANFDVGWTFDKSLRVKKSDGFSLVENQITNDWVSVYPKFWISGTTNLTVQQLKTGVSDLLADLKTTLKEDFESQGATELSFHVQYQDGRQKTSDEV